MKFVITVVHGTYSRGADWTRAGSSFCQSLAAALPGPVHIQPFEWSGKNSFGARAKAATELRRHLHELIRSFPMARHYVIAHSHGGNVALYALQDSVLLSQIEGVVCIATPFLVLRRKNIDWDLLFCLWSVLGTVQMYLAYRSLEAVLAANWSLAIPLVALVFTGIPVVATAIVGIGKWLRGRAEHLLVASQSPDLTGVRLFLVRLSADEASSGLATAQFFNWLAHVGFARLSNSAMELLKQGEIRGFRSYVWRALNESALSLAALNLIIYVLVLGKLNASGWTAIVLAVLALLFASSVARQHLIALIVIPMWIFSAFATLPFGSDLGVISLFLQVSVEDTPAGGWVSRLFVANDPPDGGKLPHLEHSAYLDERVREAIIKWIQTAPVKHADQGMGDLVGPE